MIIYQIILYYSQAFCIIHTFLTLPRHFNCGQAYLTIQEALLMKPSSPVSRRSILHGVICSFVTASIGYPLHLAAQARTKRPPNFIIFLTDDQGYGDLGCFGAHDLKTPNIDLLAAQGARLTNWYSNAPVCSPSRAALMTGRFPRRAGVPNNVMLRHLSDPTPIPQELYPSAMTIAEALRSLGYRTGAFGKWHLGSSIVARPTRRGFEEYYGFLGGGDYFSHISYYAMTQKTNAYHDLWKNETEIWEDGTYKTFIVTREAKRFVREHKDEPFFLFIAHNAPHYPMHAPQEYMDRFAGLERNRRVYAAMVATVDDGVGEIMDELKRNSLEENTCVFFQSDNGSTSEDRCFNDGTLGLYYGGSNGGLRGYKGGVFEGGIRVPGIMTWPGVIPAGQVIDELGAAFDILPTFVKLAGGEISADQKADGKDVFPMVVSRAHSPHDYLYWESGKQRALRKGNWKLILNGNLDFKRVFPESVFLADLQNDPGETANLAEKYPEKVNELRKLIEAQEADIVADIKSR